MRIYWALRDLRASSRNYISRRLPHRKTGTLVQVMPGAAPFHRAAPDLLPVCFSAHPFPPNKLLGGDNLGQNSQAIRRASESCATEHGFDKITGYPETILNDLEHPGTLRKAAERF